MEGVDFRGLFFIWKGQNMVFQFMEGRVDVECLFFFFDVGCFLFLYFGREVLVFDGLDCYFIKGFTGSCFFQYYFLVVRYGYLDLERSLIFRKDGQIRVFRLGIQLIYFRMVIKGRVVFLIWLLFRVWVFLVLEIKIK